MTGWVYREYSKGEIDRAGHLCVPWWTGGDIPDGLGNAFMIIENWRTSHSLPLNTFNIDLRRRARKVEADVIVAQRLKRFISVMNKLVREPHMKLSQMHDLGGCRAILSNVAAVNALYEMYRGNQPQFESGGKFKAYDYIKNPKADGYRGIHIVGRYLARRNSSKPWQGHRIEIQLRTRLQHAFATAVETVTTFTRQPLKFGDGPPEWRRFFSLMGSALALREGTPLVEGTPQDEAELIRALRDTTEELSVRQRLQGWTDALKLLPRKNIKGYKWLLLVLNTAENTFKVTGYADRNEASQKLSEIEQLKREELDAVLVWVSSATKLRAAYPNYYADTREFIAALDTALGS
jgi:hypothetical protein